MDDEGFLNIMSRSDDVINVAGHRLSAGALEEVGEQLQRKERFPKHHVCGVITRVCVYVCVCVAVGAAALCSGRLCCGGSGGHAEGCRSLGPVCTQER